jgi:MoxR-like ATPase
VLLDEVEKAPRDFPNGILNEIERLYFRVPELCNICIEADENYSTTIIMTNNTEKSLPDAFLRRCVYYNIGFPSREQLEEIIVARLAECSAQGEVTVMARDAVQFLLYARQETRGLAKRPGTAELLAWLTAMTKSGADPKLRLEEQPNVAERAFSALVKISGDQTRIVELLRSWKNGQSNPANGRLAS